MKQQLILEEIGIFALSLYLYSLLPYAWWLYPLLILLPDISMLGYGVNPKVGAYVYNIFHNRLLAVAIGAVGLYFSINLLLLTSVILFSHSSMDRIFGYGLKYPDRFKHTHLDEVKG